MGGQLRPGAVARILQLNPGLVLTLLQALDTLLFLADGHAEIAEIEAGQRLDLVEERFRMGALAEMPRRQKAGNDAAVDLRCWRHAKKIQARGPSAASIDDRPARLAMV